MKGRFGMLVAAMGVLAMGAGGAAQQRRGARKSARRRKNEARRRFLRHEVKILAGGAVRVGAAVIQPGIMSRYAPTVEDRQRLEARKAPPAPHVLAATQRARRARREAAKRRRKATRR